MNCTITFDNDTGHYMPTYKWVPDITDSIKRLRLQNSIYTTVWENIKNDIKIIKKYSYGGYAIFYEPVVKQKLLKVNNIAIKILLL